MQDEITFYHNPMSRGQIAHWALEEAGAPYRIELLRLDRQEHKQPAYLKVNPMGKVPAIVHRGVVVTEAAAICAYLADAFPAAKLAPPLDDPRRGTYFRWLFFGTGCIEPALTDKDYPRTGGATASQLAWGSFDDVMGTLEKALTPGPYLLGETFSAADVYVGSALMWGMLMIKSIPPRPAFTAYVERLQARPASQRTSEKNNALIAELHAGR